MEKRDIILYLSLKNNGDWQSIYRDIVNKVPINDEEAFELIKTVKAKTLTIFDEEYPVCLTNMRNPPFVLYYYGDISLLSNLGKTIAVVGSRNYSDYGKMMTEKIVGVLASELIIVSGLARGIDAISHCACIKNNGKTIAVLPCGIDYCYPFENKSIYQVIKHNHLLISEYPNGFAPTENTCRFRNRIIAALANSVLVTESYGPSGTLITVNCALEQGKELFCVPYRHTDNSHCNRLIKEGAMLADDGKDILYHLKKISWRY